MLGKLIDIILVIKKENEYILRILPNISVSLNKKQFENYLKEINYLKFNKESKDIYYLLIFSNEWKEKKNGNLSNKRSLSYG